MCIRDSSCTDRPGIVAAVATFLAGEGCNILESAQFDDVDTCLLYTSDAADERSSVDLGGSRIIKKKTITRDTTIVDHNNIE